MSIDWNTAPEGATHWEPAGLEFHEGWMKKEGNGWFFWGLDAEWKYGGDVSAEREATFEARPQEAWDGQGLPPVGVECEYRHMIWPEYRRCEIRYISDESLVAYDNGQEQYYRTHDMLFRPLRTPSRSLAEEREKAIEEMCFAVETLTVKQAKALFDAGYRRQEEGK
ncbi:hypothetical protein ACOANY_31690 [Pseudomonas aeruginosa]|uniref:hypothetical protein n=2 Tax=Pseudomonas aeruginosa TaxID=287 RepID=UPI0006674C7B|nr:hypothetical protein [Pseudomonas aeruginosa]HEJ3677415.1 hypothetical protein [Pseudomonas aeruginosa]HEK1538751.1 hypothetical protein [Pseudomonas aeruginosa]HEK1727658.1 hypothetical protein [Pseudomonas aeruginosa]HEK2205642.1 hypothetical protein [Pseudomonas aeruginosa]